VATSACQNNVVIQPRVLRLGTGIAGTNEIVLDAPFWIHLPKLVLWVLFEGNLSVFIIKTYDGGNELSKSGSPSTEGQGPD
jgi:hypothetical protein